jgi:RNA polymerase sigma-70 factor (ECF subfamily)
MRIGHEVEPAALGVDQARFTEIYARYAPLIQAYCARRVSPSQIADAAAETFLVAWRRLDEIADTDTALSWLYGLAYRVVSHPWRSAAGAHGLVDRLADVPPSEAATTEVIVLRREETEQVLAAAARLKPIDQEILRLTMWEELSYADVAAVLSIEPGAVKQRACRARRDLTKEFNRLSRSRERPGAQEEGAS